VRDRRRRRPLFSRLCLVVRDRGFGQEAGRHLVGEVTEVLVDLDLESPEASPSLPSFLRKHFLCNNLDAVFV
jgi:hypothetical protein